jgi:hypothetical protein
MGLTTRFVVVFATAHVIFGGLDVWTTELGRHRPGAVELNPMGFTPLRQSILMEIPVLFIGCLLVALGVWLRRDTLLRAPALAFQAFFGELLQHRYIGFLLLLAPIEIALLRSLAVLNNAQQLLVGWSVFAPVTRAIKAALGCSDVAAHLGMMAAFGIVAVVPISLLMYRLARHGSAGIA